MVTRNAVQAAMEQDAFRALGGTPPTAPTVGVPCQDRGPSVMPAVPYAHAVRAGASEVPEMTMSGIARDSG